MEKVKGKIWGTKTVPNVWGRTKGSRVFGRNCKKEMRSREERNNQEGRTLPTSCHEERGDIGERDVKAKGKR